MTIYFTSASDTSGCPGDQIFACWFYWSFLWNADFISKSTFRKLLSGIPSDSFDPDQVRRFVKTVCKSSAEDTSS